MDIKEYVKNKYTYFSKDQIEYLLDVMSLLANEKDTALFAINLIRAIIPKGD